MWRCKIEESSFFSCRKHDVINRILFNCMVSPEFYIRSVPSRVLVVDIIGGTKRSGQHLALMED